MSPDHCEAVLRQFENMMKNKANHTPIELQEIRDEVESAMNWAKKNDQSVIQAKARQLLADWV